MRRPGTLRFQLPSSNRESYDYAPQRTSSSSCRDGIVDLGRGRARTERGRARGQESRGQGGSREAERRSDDEADRHHFGWRDGCPFHDFLEAAESGETGSRAAGHSHDPRVRRHHTLDEHGWTGTRDHRARGASDAGAGGFRQSPGRLRHQGQSYRAGRTRDRRRHEGVPPQGDHQERAGAAGTSSTPIPGSSGRRRSRSTRTVRTSPSSACCRIIAR